MITEIYSGDCVAGMKLLPSECVDASVTSPPYNNGTRYLTHYDQRDPIEYESWCESSD